MTLPCDLERRLSDLIAFQCVLVALHGASRDATEEMLWQTFLWALVLAPTSSRIAPRADFDDVGARERLSGFYYLPPPTGGRRHGVREVSARLPHLGLAGRDHDTRAGTQAEGAAPHLNRYGLRNHIQGGRRHDGSRCRRGNQRRGHDSELLNGLLHITWNSHFGLQKLCSQGHRQDLP